MKTKNILLVIAVLLVAWIGVGSQIPTVLPTSPVTEFVEFLKGVRIAGPVEMGPLSRSLKTWWNFEDFVAGFFAGQKVGIWDARVGGTGADFFDTVGTAMRPGIAQGTTGTTITGRTGLFCGLSGLSAFLFGGGVCTFETDIKITTLSDVTETIEVYVGFGDSLTGDSTDGAYFKYSDVGATPNWYAVTANNSTRTTTNTIVAAANTWTRLKIVVNSTGTSVAYYINGANVANNTTNIPTAAGRETSGMINIYKPAGTTARTFQVDWTWLHVDLNVSR